MRRWIWGRSARRSRRKLVVGDVAPEVTATTTDGEPLSLTALRGKLVVLAFSYGDARQEQRIIQTSGDVLKDVHAKFGEDARLAIVELLTHTSEIYVQQYIKEISPTWTQAWLGPYATSPLSEYYFGPFPLLWVIGPDGKILAANVKREDLQDAVAQRSADLNDHVLRQETRFVIASNGLFPARRFLHFG